MGNAAASCAPSLLSSSSSSNGVIKVLSSSDGRTEIYRRPIKAAELMLQNPGMFVCDSTSLQVGHRIHGLSADQLLDKKPQQQQQLYLLLPMELLYSVLTLEEMASFNSLLVGTNLVISDNPTKTSLNHSINFGKIFPSLGEFCMFLPQSNSSNDHNSEVVERNYYKQRSWRPALDTIVETTPSSKQHY